MLIEPGTRMSSRNSIPRGAPTPLRVLTIVLLLVSGAQTAAGPMPRDAVPEPLAPWVDWVLHGQERAACPFLFGAFEEKRCAWPGRLEIDVDATGATFSQDWRLHADDWIPLPGDAALWPQEVNLDDSTATVAPSAALPRIRAAAGAHTVTGRVLFERIPEFLKIPDEIGLVRLRVSGREVAVPELDAKGRLWLSADRAPRDDAAEVKNTLELRVYRRVIDEVPLRVLTRIDLDVSGEHREILLGPVLLAEAIPLALQTQLPARVEPDGRLRIQVRPGRWAITLAARHPGPVTALTRPDAASDWPGQEIWVFDARNQLRLVQIEGVPSVEPRQTSLPDDWRNLPAYRVAAGDAFRIVVKRRGDPQPEPDRLALDRTLWLDFDGRGYTVNDRVSGQLSRSWRLEAEPLLDLGRVAVDGEPWFITRQPGVERKGVELRRGQLDLSADARVEDRGDLPAVGWDHDFQSVRAHLNVPPGWRLLSATGVDRVNHTWISRWTLFDLFLVLIIAAVVARLWSWRWGLVALLAIGLVYHEADAPRQIWLHIFAATALLRVLPKGSFSRWVGIYRNLSLVALVVILLPFAVYQVRVALFPQLERPWQTQPGIDSPAAARDALVKQQQEVRLRQPARTPAAVDGPVARLEEKAVDLLSEGTAERPASKIGRLYGSGDRLAQIDPKANIQTGPGLPHWQWSRAELIWNGPVARDQSMALLLLPPAVNLVLRILSVVLLALLALRALDTGRGRPFSLGGRYAGGAAAVFAVGIFAALMTDPARAAAFPDPQLLDELRGQLLAAPDCVPECASLPRMILDVGPDRLSVRMEVHASAPVAVPLPGRQGAWLPDTVQVDGFVARGVLRGSGGSLWVVVSPGVHQVVAAGSLPARERVEIALPLRPHRVEVETRDWEVDGVHENGVVEGQIQLRRMRAATAQPEALAPGALPPFVRVERTLLLGLKWRMLTRVARVSPPGAAVVLELPLIEGESVTSEGVRVEGGRVQVSLDAQAAQTQWESVLEQTSRIELRAPEATSWTEVWRLDASPIWHVEAEGIPVIHQQQQGRRFPEWRPWPGESISLKVSRPEGVPGRTLTIDAAVLRLQPGRRATDADLVVRLRSSQGVQHPLTLPEGAKLQSVTIDGRSQPIRQDDRVVTVPLTPGAHRLKLTWRTAQGIGVLFPTPGVEVGAESVNAALRIDVPQSRWVLFTGGPALGPAVMFWGLLIVIVAVAFGLGRTGRTPLKVRHWVLLGLGLSQIPIYFAIIVVGWLFALDARGRLDVDMRKLWFNLMQVGLAILILVALGMLFFAVKQGLLGLPNMQISGNGSNGYLLKWFADRAGETLPDAWVLSVPLTVYRLLMLAWALWIAFALVAWLRWSWECFSAGGYWRSVTLGRPKSTNHALKKASDDDKADRE